MNNKIGIIGLGYVGAPLAYLASSKGFEVIGIDNNDKAIKKVNERRNIPNKINPRKILKLKASKDYSLLRKTEIIIICVPTPTKNNKPDLSILCNVMEKIYNHIEKGTLIIMESTVAPGMTKHYIADYLEKKKIFMNIDYDLAYCPERIDPGNKEYWVENINRVIRSFI